MGSITHFIMIQQESLKKQDCIDITVYTTLHHIQQIHFTIFIRIQCALNYIYLHLLYTFTLHHIQKIRFTIFICIYSTLNYIYLHILYTFTLHHIQKIHFTIIYLHLLHTLTLHHIQKIQFTLFLYIYCILNYICLHLLYA